MANIQIFILFLLSAVTLSTSVPSTRIINGNPVDTLRRFPHHVTIYTEQKEGSEYCSGSIIHPKWILTSMRCLQFSSQYRIDFNRRKFNETYSQHSSLFSITVGSSAAILYPTEYPQQDDIALLRLPIKLDFSDRFAYPIQSIDLDLTDFSSNKLTVMPGFNENKTELTYGMFRKSSDCYGYDKRLQFCARGWNNGNQVPCKGNEGGGLIVGWPQYPRLVGIFSYSADCKKGSPSFYTDIKHYIPWIRFIITGEDADYNDDIPSGATNSDVTPV